MKTRIAVEGKNAALSLALLAAMAAATPVLAQSRECPAAGVKVHWMADYCMSKLETDDEIAASSCINVELERVFRSECVAKVHYKRALCRLAISRQQTRDSIKICLDDKTFMGPTVRNGGVGGR